jgi:Heterokaryon incompatibility protein (HET)
MATSTAIFAYASLDSKQADSFRLLSLLPGLNNSPIECTLRHTRRSAPFQPYEALSYAWGDPNLTSEILVNGLPLSITRNLEHALRSLRQDSAKDGAARTLWVDAICIDQSHVLERNHQVAQMDKIYAGAERVVIWLGDSSDDSDMAIAFMRKVYERLAANGEFSGYTVRSGQYLEKNFQDGIEEFLGPEYDDEWEAVARLLSRDWWERAWVVQELVVAKDAICYCGKTSLAWSVVCANIDAIGNGLLMTIAQSSHHFSKSGALDSGLWRIISPKKVHKKRSYRSLESTTSKSSARLYGPAR